MKATRAAFTSMTKENGLQASAMPQTIEDAMSVCSQLEFDYLWVDRLCIIQDDQEDRTSQIAAMGDIYSSTSLVLIVAYGNNMDFGIPGVSRPRPSVQRHVEVAGLQVTNIVEDPWEDELAKWSTRGWTYQEAILARRRLYFTNRRAYFECGTSCCHEDAYNPETRLLTYASHRFSQEGETSRFETFARHLLYYSTRNLSYHSDVYHAFTGITNVLYGRDSRMINGLPEVDFDRALRWWVNLGTQSISRLENGEAVCPTWSWSTAMGCAGDTIVYQGTDLYGSLALWYRVRPASLPLGSEIEPVNFHPDTEMDDNWEIYMAIACEEGCLRNVDRCWSSAAGSFRTMREKIVARWPGYHTYCKDALQPPEPLELLRRYENFNDLVYESKPGLIFASTQCALLQLRAIPEQGVGVGIFNHQGDFIGEICGQASRLREKVLSRAHEKEILYEFVALSVSGREAISHADEAMTNNYYDEEGQPIVPIPIVNLLLIEWSGKYAARKQLGWAYLKQWGKVEREWKTVRLE